MQTEPPAIAACDLVAHLVAELALDDLELAGALLTLPPTHLLEPLPALVRVAESFWGLVPGACADYESRVPMLVAAALRGDARPVTRALWRAQTRVLFPLLEEHRSMLVETRPPWLRPPYQLWHGEVIDDPFDLELGHLLHLLRQASPLHPRVRELATLTKIRNELAHLRPCPTSLLACAEVRPLIDLSALH